MNKLSLRKALITIFKRPVILGFFLQFLIIACTKEPNSQIITDDPTIIQDQYGRHLILHGLNTSGDAKWEPQRQPWITEANVEKEVTEFGFNFVRYLVFWDAIEPQKGVFDDSYLDKVEQRVNWYTSRGAHVMIDMHQDLYSGYISANVGDGAPLWACRTNGEAPIAQLPAGVPWGLINVTPAVANSWINFWQYTTHTDLQEHYILAWQKVAQRFRNNKNVIGYDLMNEPYGGDVIKSFITGAFEKQQLAALYHRLIPAIRSIEPDKYIFIEPASSPSAGGFASNLSKINDTRPIPHLVYAPHNYTVPEAVGYNAASKLMLKSWENVRITELKKQNNIPMLTGEFGLPPTDPGFDLYLKDFTAMSDKYLWNWAYWENGKGGWSPFNEDLSETPIAQYLLRAFPHAVAGKITAFSFNPSTKIFTLKYKSNTAIHQPTEIFLPKRFYPDGYNIKVIGTDNYTSTFDAGKNILNFTVADNLKDITITITPE